MLTEQQETRGVGRPSQGKRHRTFTLASKTITVLDAIPAGERSKYIDKLVARNQEQKGQS